MKLYYSPGACSQAPHIALRELGLAFDAVPVDLATHTLPDGSDYGLEAIRASMCADFSWKYPHPRGVEYRGAARRAP